MLLFVLNLFGEENSPTLRPLAIKKAFVPCAVARKVGASRPGLKLFSFLNFLVTFCFKEGVRRWNREDSNILVILEEKLK
jgi:hypothetical protein